MEIGLVEKVDIDHQMQQAYLDYAMSVIVSRALPDARDGLKPVHRRILYAMYDMGLRPDSPYKKSARIVGEVLGKYHPHGDMAVYEAMARMAQDFSMRYLLVDGQGNFGSVDGDSPAAMRYTEARLAPPSQNLLADIQRNTVNFSPNFDGSLSEPDVLPAALPNLLINGATGIAVGMSTSIPPHNLGEVIDALKYMLENWTKLDDINVDDLMRFIQGPDFPTGGVIIQETGEEDLHSAYGSGRGRVIVQAHARLEEMERGRSRIIVTELPYMTNKASLIERIAELVREEKLEGIADLRDESDRHGMRIVIELTKTADPETVLRDLYKHTPMQGTFSIIMLALVDGEPRMLSLKQALRVYLDHRLEIVKRRSQYDLEKARQRAHILEGLRIALKNLDEVIDLIRKAPDAETARERLMKRFKLSEIQAQAILDLQLRRLASLERKKIEQEYKDVQALIKELESLLRSPVKMRTVIAEELQAVKDAYGDRRRTQIVRMKAGESRRTLLSATDLVQSQPVWVSVTPEGLITRTLEDRMPRLSGNDAPAWLVRTNSRDTLYLVSEKGEAAALSVHSLPQNENPAEGVPFWKVSALHDGDRLAGLLALPPKTERGEASWYVLTVTRAGMIKKTDLSELPGPSASGFTLVKVNEGDRMFSLRLTNGAAEILLATAGGMAIRFSEEEVRPMGLMAAGVMGIRLGQGDEIAGMEVLPQPGDIFMISSEGGAKRVPVKEFPKQGRYGQGVSAWKLSGKARLVGLAVGKGTARATLHLEKLAPKAIRLDDAPLGSRTTRGNVLPDVKGNLVQILTIPWNPPRPGSGASGLVGMDGGEPDGDSSAGKRGRGGSGGSSRGGPKAPEQNGRPKTPAARAKGKAAASSKANLSGEPSAIEKTTRKRAISVSNGKAAPVKSTRAASKSATLVQETVKGKTTRKTAQVQSPSSTDIADELVKTARITKKVPPSEESARLKARAPTAAAKPAPAPLAGSAPKKASPASAKTSSGKSSETSATSSVKPSAKISSTKVAPSAKSSGKSSSPKAASTSKPAVGKSTSPKTAPSAKPSGKSTSPKAASASKPAVGKSTSAAKPAGKTGSTKAAPAPKPTAGKSTATKPASKTTPQKSTSAAKPAEKASSPKSTPSSAKTSGKTTPKKTTPTTKAAGKPAPPKASSSKKLAGDKVNKGAGGHRSKKKAPSDSDIDQLTLLDLGPVASKTAPRKKSS